MTTKTISLRGSKRYGEWHADGKSAYGAGNGAQDLYRTADGVFVIVGKAEFSGKITSIKKASEQGLAKIERYDTLNLGYAMVSMYRFRDSSLWMPTVVGKHAVEC